jgi:hypothetical protein
LLSLGCLSSPALSWFSLTIPLFSEEAGHHHRFKGQDTITIPLFSLSRFSLTIPLFSEEAGHHHRFKGQDTITISMFSLSRFSLAYH